MLVWMDLEMTGLDHTVEVIVEIATIITDDDLQIVAEGPDLVIHQADDVLARMDPFVVDMHTKSGLLDQIKASEVSLEAVVSRDPAIILVGDSGAPAIASAPEWQAVRAVRERRFVRFGPPAFGPVPDMPSPPKGWVPTTAPIWLRLT